TSPSDGKKKMKHWPVYGGMLYVWRGRGVAYSPDNTDNLRYKHSSERVFSAAGNVVTSFQGILKPDKGNFWFLATNMKARK
ncbi:Hypothetical protein FKW44_008691, partial [Caligus rogercresseyi]